jgi:uncharacterized protein (DUF2147 family)
MRLGVFALLLAVLIATPVGAESPTLAGIWLHENQRIKVEIAPCGAKLCGKIVWFKWPNDAEGAPLADLQNPDPALQARPLLGLQILRNLKYSGGATWEGGKIYNPDDGENYRAEMTLQADGTVLVRAYVLFPIFGETQIWTPVE